MPIFAYRCASCGFQKDVLQKRSDPPLATCPACEQDSFAKQLTAPAFQLKGNGWYVTDFRDKGKTKPGESAESGSGEGVTSVAAGDKAKSDGAAQKSAGTDSSSAMPDKSGGSSGGPKGGSSGDGSSGSRSSGSGSSGASSSGTSGSSGGSGGARTSGTGSSAQTG